MEDPKATCSKCNHPLSNRHPHSKSNINIIIKCHGDECTNKFHLSCITNIPKNSKVYYNALKQQQPSESTESNNHDYICDKCDVEGASKYLMEYFEDFLCKRQLYFSNTTTTQSSFLTFLFQQTEHVYKINSTKPSEINYDFINDVYCKSNASRKKYLEERIRRRSTLSTISSTSDLNDADDIIIDESIFIGKPIRLYNPVDDTYHIGRVIDWRRKNTTATTSTKLSSYPVIPNDFSSIEYLVRFREGLNSRKVAVHQWITLEEHAISIGLHLIWANINPSSDLQDFILPGQIMLRSALEMIPIKRSLLQNPINTDTYVFCVFFNHKHHSIISILDQSIPFDFRHAQGKKSLIDSFSKKDLNNLKPGEQNDSDDSTFAISIAMACIEYEEQSRIRSWHKLPMIGYITSAVDTVSIEQGKKKDDDQLKERQGYLPDSITLKRSSEEKSSVAFHN